jgi:hypothetical protein
LNRNTGTKIHAPLILGGCPGSHDPGVRFAWCLGFCGDRSGQGYWVLLGPGSWWYVPMVRLVPLVPCVRFYLPTHWIMALTCGYGPLYHGNCRIMDTKWSHWGRGARLREFQGRKAPEQDERRLDHEVESLGDARPQVPAVPGWSAV